MIIRKNILLAAICVIIIDQSLAQFAPSWSVDSGDQGQFGSMMTLDHEGNILVTAFRPSYLFDPDVFTYKYSPDGDLLWETQDASSTNDLYQASRWINVDSQNNVYVTGYLYSGTNSQYTHEIIVIKYSPSGAFQWKKNIPNVYPGGLNLRTEIDNSDYIYIGTVSVNPGFRFLKLNTEGDILIDESDAASFNQYFDSMRLKGNRVVMSSYAGNGFQSSICVFDLEGNVIWTSYQETDGAPDIEMDNNENVYVLGRETNLVNDQSNFDFKITKFNHEGAIVDEFSFDFGNSTDFPTRMTISGDRLTVIGWFIRENEAYSSWITFQCDLDGNIIWQQEYDELNILDEKPRWVSARENGDVYVSGQGGPGFNSIGSTYMQYVTIKYHNGEEVWQDFNPYQGYIGVINQPKEDCGLYVLGETTAALHYYEEDCLVESLSETVSGATDELIHIFPNPCRENIQIDIKPNHSKIPGLSIRDITGREFDSIQTNCSTNHIQHILYNTAILPTGIYFIQYEAQRIKFIKE